MTTPKWYDITYPAKAGEEAQQFDQIKKICGEILDCENYGFQLEMGSETGYLHWQIRIQLKKGMLETAMRKCWLGGHVSVTSAKGRNFEYVTKKTTAQGYRFCTQALMDEVFEEQIRDSLRKWQEEALATLTEQNNREVLVVIDEQGNNGKTWFTKWLVYFMNAQAVPKYEESEDMVGVVMANSDKKTFIFDLPRAEGKSNKAMWSAIEQVKNGHLYDKRYNFKEKWIKSPQVLVFTNHEPNKDDLSGDRWIIRYLQDGVLYDENKLRIWGTK